MGQTAEVAIFRMAEILDSTGATRPEHAGIRVMDTMESHFRVLFGIDVATLLDMGEERILGIVKEMAPALCDRVESVRLLGVVSPVTDGFWFGSS